MNTAFFAWPLMLAAAAAGAPLPPGFLFGKTAVRLSAYGLDAQVPEGVAVGQSNPFGLRLAQEFYRGAGLRWRLNGELAWDEAKESCFMLGCMDFSSTGRYFWNTHYSAAALHLSPLRGGWLGGFGAVAGLARFHYQWGVSEQGWDSRYPGGRFLAGEFKSHQAFIGADYTVSLVKACWGFALTGGLRQTVAARNTFTPRLLQGELKDFGFPAYPQAFHLSLALEL